MPERSDDTPALSSSKQRYGLDNRSHLHNLHKTSSNLDLFAVHSILSSTILIRSPTLDFKQALRITSEFTTHCTLHIKRVMWHTSSSHSQRSGTRSRLTISNLEELEAGSASKRSHYSGSTMISPRGTRYQRGARASSCVSSLRPEDSASNISSGTGSHTRSGLARQYETHHSSKSHLHGSRISERYPRTSNYPTAQGDARSESRYTPSSHSQLQHSAISRNTRLPEPLFDIEERTPSDYPRFQEMGYTGDRGSDNGGITRGEYEATYGIPKSKRGVSRSQMSGTGSQRAYKVEESEPGTYAGSSRSKAGSSIRMPNAYERY